jgi:hypothetical protein
VGLYVGALFAVSALFPLSLPPVFSPATASQYVVQPDWYLLWLYQVLKFQAFEGGNAILALVGLALAYVLLLIMPFVDKSRRIYPGERPVFVTLGAVALAEVITLIIWGYLTPGQVIPDIQSVIVIGLVAAFTAIGVLLSYSYRASRTLTTSIGVQIPQIWEPKRAIPAFIVLLVVASVSLSSLVGSIGYCGWEILLPLALVAVGSISSMAWLIKGSAAYHERMQAQ